jgi:hypothetical protein
MAFVGLPMLGFVMRNLWLRVGLIVGVVALGWVAYEVWFGLTQAR